MTAAQLRAIRSRARFAPRLPGGRARPFAAAERRALAVTAACAAVSGIAVALIGIGALYLCLAVIGCAFILRDFRVGVVLLILLLPLSRSYIFPHAMLGVTGLNPLNLLLAGTLFAWLARGWQERFVPRPLLWLYIAPILLAGIAGTRHVDEISAAYYLYEMLEFNNVAGYVRDMVVKPLTIVLFALLVAAAVRRTGSPKVYLAAALASMWVMSALVIVFVGLSGATLGELGSSTSRSFLSPLGLHANELGRLYVVGYALILFSFAAAEGRNLRLVLLASLGTVFVALVLTFSRGAFLGFALVNLLFLLWNRSTRTLLVVAAAAAVAFVALPDAVYERILAGHGSGANEVSAGRIDTIWIPLVPDLLSHPLFGNGLGAILWSDAIRRGAGASILLVTHPHNAYLQALLDMGIAGLAALCAYFLHAGRSLRSLAADARLPAGMRGFYRGAVAGLVSFLIAGISDSSLAPVPEQSFLWLAIGIMYGQGGLLQGREPARASASPAAEASRA